MRTKSAFLVSAIAALLHPGCGDDGPPPKDTTPFIAEPFEWTYIPVTGAKCRDGSDTGVVVSLNPDSDRVVIYLEGGGACFNSLSCGLNPSSFDGPGFGGRSRGLFDREDEANPVADWSFVYVPYCTGDVHIGDRPDTTVPGLPTPQQFVGYRNMELNLARIVSTFPDASQVLLTGSSAGGFGAAGNYAQTQEAFGDVPVTLLDDSGPPVDAPWLPPCLLDEWVELFGAHKTVFADCGDGCTDQGRFLFDYMRALDERWPDRPRALFSYTSDTVVRMFFSFGFNDCSTGFPSVYPEEEFLAGLDDLRAFVDGEGLNFGTFYAEGDAHTILSSDAVYTLEAGGMLFVDWVRELVDDGFVSHVGP
jgi:hypothetical protein